MEYDFGIWNYKIWSCLVLCSPYSKIMFQNYIPYSKITFQNHIPCSKIIFQNHISNPCSKSQPTKKFHVPYSMVHVPQKNEPTNEPHINSNRERSTDLWNQRRIPPYRLTCLLHALMCHNEGQIAVSVPVQSLEEMDARFANCNTAISTWLHWQWTWEILKSIPNVTYILVLQPFLK